MKCVSSDFTATLAVETREDRMAELLEMSSFEFLQEELRDAIKRKMKSDDLTYYDVGKLLGMNSTNIKRVVTGERGKSTELLLNIVDILEIPFRVKVG